jgi:hypothetical protein
LAAFHFDAAVMRFGQALEQDLQQTLEAARGRGRRRKELTQAQQNMKITEIIGKWLGIKPKQQYRDPAVIRGA